MQVKNILFSIITVVYNDEDNIEKTILSVLAQTYRNIEYIIIDGASTDRTLSVINKYKDRVSKIISEPDLGIYDAMNKGINIAKGDYISLLNSGDTYERDTCQIVSNKINELKADIYHGMIRVFDDKQLISIQGCTIHNIKNSMINHPTCFVSKQIYSKNTYDLRYKSASDYDFIIKNYNDGAVFCFIEKILANFYLGGISSSKNGLLETTRILYKYKYIGLIKFIIRYLRYTFL
jgi:glycosyltransferase involved in cell wall biosynthesis